jgi:hypothetical protein
MAAYRYPDTPKFINLKIAPTVISALHFGHNFAADITHTSFTVAHLKVDEHIA